MCLQNTFTLFSLSDNNKNNKSKHGRTTVMLSGGEFPHVTQLTSLYTEMKNISNRAKEIILAYQGSFGEGREGRWLLDSQHVHIWQSFAQGWPTQRHCAPVIAALQQQMKLSAGRWLYSDSRSTLSLQSVANKYVGFQSCQGRRWTVGQGAKHRAKAFPSPRNLFSMSLVTSPGHPFSASHPKGPGAPDLTHCLPGEFCEPRSPSDSHHSLSLSLFLCASLCLPHWRAKNILSREKWRAHATQFKPFMTECDSVWWEWNDLSPLTQCEKTCLFIKFLLMMKSRFHHQSNMQVKERHWFVFCCLNGADRPSAVWDLLLRLLSPPFFPLL